MESSNEILEKACERHGSFVAFQSIQAIQIRLVKLAGWVPRMKGLGLTFNMPEKIVVSPSSSTVSFQYLDETITYDHGAIIAKGMTRSKYRERFSGLRKLRFWNRNDACYFFGYALAGYFGLPFTLNQLEVLNSKVSRNDTSWIQLRFPSGADTHSQIQRFWFDQTGLLVRHDYCADIIGPMFWGAHFSTDYCFDYPIPIARTRTVKLRLGRFATPLKVLVAQFQIESVH